MIRKLGFNKAKTTTFLETPDEIELKTEQLISSIALRFVQVVPSVIDPTILDSLEKIQMFTRSERAYIYMFKQKNKQLKLKYLFNVPGSDDKIAQHDQVDGPDFVWMMRTLNDHKPIMIESVSKLPPRASTLKLIMDVENTKSMILTPLVLDDVLTGVIGLDTTKEERQWSEDEAHLLEMSAKVFVRVMEQNTVVKGESKPNSNLDALFRDIEDVIFVSTPKGKLVEINPTGLKLFGYDSEWEMMKLQIDQDLFYEPAEHKRYIKIIEEHGRIKEYKIALKHKDGTKISVEVTSTVIRNNNGKIIAYAGIMRDVTQKHELEQQFFQSQKMESIGLLAGGIAHDFNNILTAITGYADLLMMKLGETHPLHRIATSILKSGERAENLTKQLLGFSRKQVIEPRAIDINEEISDLNKMFDRLISGDIQLRLDLMDGLKNIMADPVQIQQILVNLVVNAGHAIKDQGKNNKEKFIRISTSKQELTEEFVRQHPGSRIGDYLLISVEDSGSGMDKETLQRIFEPFFSTKEKDKGTGLGLATVYGIVKQNNALIYVDSTLGEGTVFEIYWPTTSVKSQSTKKESKLAEYEDRTECILVAEDDDNVRELACTALTTLGYNVLAANNGVQALQIIEEQKLTNKLDLLFTDMIMPEMGGDELAAKVRELNPKIKILLTSGYTESQIYFGGADQRTGYFKLNKPYTVQKLESKIRTVLEHKA